jgi:hypothetical protein
LDVAAGKSVAKGLTQVVPNVERNVNANFISKSRGTDWPTKRL